MVVILTLTSIVMACLFRIENTFGGTNNELRINISHYNMTRVKVIHRKSATIVIEEEKLVVRQPTNFCLKGFYFPYR